MKMKRYFDMKRECTKSIRGLATITSYVKKVSRLPTPASRTLPTMQGHWNTGRTWRQRTRSLLFISTGTLLMRKCAIFRCSSAHVGNSGGKLRTSQCAQVENSLGEFRTDSSHYTSQQSFVSAKKRGIQLHVMFCSPQSLISAKLPDIFSHEDRSTKSSKSD